jgi:hypothetical protein
LQARQAAEEIGPAELAQLVKRVIVLEQVGVKLRVVLPAPDKLEQAP